MKKFFYSLIFFAIRKPSGFSKFSEDTHPRIPARWDVKKRQICFLQKPVNKEGLNAELIFLCGWAGRYSWVSLWAGKVLIY